MKVKDLLIGMESRAMDAHFQKDICALYDTKDYGDTEPDCQTGYTKLLPLLTEEQKMSMEQMEQAYIHRRNYAAQYGFKCGIFGASGSSSAIPKPTMAASMIWFFRIF